MNPHLRTENYKGKTIHVHDYHQMQGPAFVSAISSVVTDSLLLNIPQFILIDVTGANANSDVVAAFKKAAIDIKPVTVKMAVIGVTPLQRVILNAINMFSDLGVAPFETKEDALAWLIQDSS